MSGAGGRSSDPMVLELQADCNVCLELEEGHQTPWCWSYRLTVMYVWSWRKVIRPHGAGVTG
ncbi:hypothetical protein LEMLEM_LOCUS428 [Lemmus lemmus]